MPTTHMHHVSSDAARRHFGVIVINHNAGRVSCPPNPNPLKGKFLSSIKPSLDLKIVFLQTRTPPPPTYPIYFYMPRVWAWDPACISLTHESCLYLINRRDDESMRCRGRKEPRSYEGWQQYITRCSVGLAYIAALSLMIDLAHSRAWITGWDRHHDSDRVPGYHDILRMIDSR